MVSGKPCKFKMRARGGLLGARAAATGPLISLRVFNGPATNRDGPPAWKSYVLFLTRAETFILARFYKGLEKPCEVVLFLTRPKRSICFVFQ